MNIQLYILLTQYSLLWLQVKEPIIADAAQLMKLALDCIYITKRYSASLVMYLDHGTFLEFDSVYKKLRKCKIYFMIVACFNRFDQLDLSFSILECLPASNEE